MPTYRMAAPDGQTYQIDGPDGASDDQVREQIIKQNPHLGSSAPAASAEPQQQQWQRPPSEGIIGAGINRLKRGGKAVADAIYPAAPAPPKSWGQFATDTAVGVGGGLMEVAGAITAPLGELVRPAGEAMGRRMAQTPEQVDEDISRLQMQKSRLMADPTIMNTSPQVIEQIDYQLDQARKRRGMSLEQQAYNKGGDVAMAAEILGGAAFGKPFKWRGPVASEAPAAAFMTKPMAQALREVPAPLRPGQSPIMDMQAIQPELVPAAPPARQIRRPFEEAPTAIEPQPTLDPYAIPKAAPEEPIPSAAEAAQARTGGQIPPRAVAESSLFDAQGRPVRNTPEPGQGTAERLVSPHVDEAPLATPEQPRPLKEAGQIAEERTGGALPQQRKPIRFEEPEDAQLRLDQEAESGIERALRQGMEPEVPEGPTQRLIREGKSISGGSGGFTEASWVKPGGEIVDHAPDVAHETALVQNHGFAPRGTAVNGDAFSQGYVRAFKHADGFMGLELDLTNPTAVQSAIKYITERGRGIREIYIDATPRDKAITAGIKLSNTFDRPYKAAEFLRQYAGEASAAPRMARPISGGSDAPLGRNINMFDKAERTGLYEDVGWMTSEGKEVSHLGKPQGNRMLGAKYEYELTHVEALQQMGLGDDMTKAFQNGMVRYARAGNQLIVEAGVPGIDNAITYISRNGRNARGGVIVEITDPHGGMVASKQFDRPWQAIEYLKSQQTAAAPEARAADAAMNQQVRGMLAEEKARQIRPAKPISGGSDAPIPAGEPQVRWKKSKHPHNEYGFTVTADGKPYEVYFDKQSGQWRSLDLVNANGPGASPVDGLGFNRAEATERITSGDLARKLEQYGTKPVRPISGGSDAPIEQPLKSAREIGMRRKPKETPAEPEADLRASIERPLGSPLKLPPKGNRDIDKFRAAQRGEQTTPFDGPEGPGAAATLPKQPKTPEDLVTVYRGEGTEKAALPEWAKTNAGQWFTTSKSKAEGFAAERAGNVRELQVPRSYLKDYAVEGTADEFLIPQVAQKNLAARTPLRREPAPQLGSDKKTPFNIEAVIKQQLPEEVRNLVGSKRVPKGNIARWKARIRKALPQEEFVNHEAPNSPVITEMAWHHADTSSRTHELLQEPWLPKVKKLDPEAIKDWEQTAVDIWDASDKTPAALEKAIASWPEELKDYARYRNARLAEENASRARMKLPELDELPGPYLPHVTDAELSASTHIGNRASGGGLQTSLRGAQEHRVARTMREGEAKYGLEYIDPRNAILVREWNGIQMTQTERLVTALKGRALYDTAEAAKAASKTGEAFPVSGMPGADMYWTGSKAEALFLAQNIAQRASGLQLPGKIGNLKTYADQLFRNPNLVNPAPHVVKNMWAKYIAWSKDVNPATVVRDGIELFRKPDLDTVKLFREYMPYADDERGFIQSLKPGTSGGDPAYAQFQHALVKGPVESLVQTGIDALATLNKPSSHVIFKWGDPSMRYSLFKKYLKEGMPPQQAANNAWVDLVNYATRSDLVDFWTSIPMNFFVKWRVGSVTSVGKMLVKHPMRAAIVFGGIDMIREYRYRQTGRWTHLPWDYFEGPLVTAVDAILEGNASRLSFELFANAMFGPSGEATAGNIKRMVTEPRNSEEFLTAVGKVFWGLAQLLPGAEIGKEWAAYQKDGNPSHLINAILSALVAERDTKGYKPHSVTSFIPEDVMPFDYKVKYDRLTNPANK